MRRDLRKLPEELRDCAEAAAALELARVIDQGLAVATSTKQLLATMAQLRARAVPVVVKEAREKTQATPPTKGTGIADLTARIAATRGQSASG